MKETKEKIVRQALVYFCQNDYQGASLNDIAGALGITKGAIYHYFGSKDELFKEAVMSAMDDLSGLFGQMSEGREDSSFKDVLQAWFNFGAMAEGTAEVAGLDILNDYAVTIYLMFTALKKFPEVGKKLNDIYMNMMSSLNCLLMAAAESGDIRDDIDTEALAFELTAFAEGGMLMGSVLIDIDLADLGRRTFDNFWKRIEKRGDHGKES